MHVAVVAASAADDAREQHIVSSIHSVTSRGVLGGQLAREAQRDARVAEIVDDAAEDVEACEEERASSRLSRAARGALRA